MKLTSSVKPLHDGLFGFCFDMSYGPEYKTPDAFAKWLRSVIITFRTERIPLYEIVEAKGEKDAVTISADWAPDLYKRLEKEIKG